MIRVVVARLVFKERIPFVVEFVVGLIWLPVLQRLNSVNEHQEVAELHWMERSLVIGLDVAPAVIRERVIFVIDELAGSLCDDASFAGADILCERKLPCFFFLLVR